jgi:uracil-DNA glycosylase
VVDERGDPWEHDPGPATAGGWAALFADTPNYRGLSRAVLGREAFRWHHGPMFFRGRLDGSAKVVLVGQEGAQDESLSHRSFTGGTGARMQHLLRHLGLDRSYLFLNSFVYPIFGQYTDDLRPLAQDRRSPIVAHRHRILDKAIVDGDVRLVVAVGRAAKESVATWIRAHGGSADPERLHQASLGALPGRLLAVGVVHPGSATGGSTSAIKADFQRACDLVRGRVEADAGWLPADPGVERDLAAPFQYQSAAIPYRDFPFGTCPRLGRGGTSSNRADAQRAIQLFSAAGHYNGAGDHLRYGSTADGSRDGYSDDPGDLPYEPPRAAPTAFDPGPPAGLARLLLGMEPGLGWPDFAALGVTSHPSFGVGRSTGAGSATSAWSSWPTRPPTTTCSPDGRCPGKPASGWSGSCAPPG